MSDRVDVLCPCCRTKLVVDAASGEVLAETREPTDHRANFETAMEQVRSGSQRREDAFSRAFDRTKRLDDLLSKKFEEAKKKAEGDPTPPRSPFDLD